MAHSSSRFLLLLSHYKDTKVKEVMTPLVHTYMLNVDEKLNFETIAVIFKTGYSRIPVYEISVNNVIGLLFVKDLIFIDPEDETPVRNFVQIFGRGVHVVWPDDTLGDVLRELKQGRSHMALVRDVNNTLETDPFYEIVGIITLEDIIEEIVGDISDEFDDENLNYSQIDERNFLFEGKINLKDFYRITGSEEDDFETHKGDAETLAGFILEIFAALPKKGQKITFKQHIFTIEAVDNKRIKQIKVTLAEDSQ